MRIPIALAVPVRVRACEQRQLGRIATKEKDLIQWGNLLSATSDTPARSQGWPGALQVARGGTVASGRKMARVVSDARDPISRAICRFFWSKVTSSWRRTPRPAAHHCPTRCAGRWQGGQASPTDVRTDSAARAGAKASRLMEAVVRTLKAAGPVRVPDAPARTQQQRCAAWASSRRALLSGQPNRATTTPRCSSLAKKEFAPARLWRTRHVEPLLRCAIPCTRQQALESMHRLQMNVEAVDSTGLLLRPKQADT